MPKRILFQGDSITDAGRNREDFYSLGYGYPLLVAAHLTAEHPGEFPEHSLHHAGGGQRVPRVARGLGDDSVADHRGGA